jgi:hypothetical protein
MSKELRIPPGLGIVEFKLQGMTCYRWFDEDGVLCATSPQRGTKAIKTYLAECSALISDPEIVDFAKCIEPLAEEELPIKLHAIMELVFGEAQEHDDDAEFELSSEQVESKVAELKQKDRSESSSQAAGDKKK